MAFQSFNSTDSVLSNTTATIPAKWTTAVWYMPAHVPGNLTPQTAIASASGTGLEYGLSWDHVTASFRGTWYYEDTTSGFPFTQYVTAFVPGVWYLLAGTYDGTTLGAWINGRLDASSTPANQIKIGAAKFGHGAIFAGTNSAKGIVGESGWWNAALSQAELRMLATGVPFNWVRKNNLFTYSKLSGPALFQQDMGMGGIIRSYGVNGMTPYTDAPRTNLSRTMNPAWFSQPPLAAGGFIPAWAIPSNMPVIGTGTY